jgi:hypothetical protein
MNALEAETYIRSKLDGFFFTLDTTRGEEAEPRVFAKRVSRDFLPFYHLLEDETETAREYARLAGDKKHRPWTDEETERMVALRQAGTRWDYIARQIRRCNRAVKERYAAIAIERNLPPPVNKSGRYSTLTDEQKAEIVKRRSAGESYGEIGRALGISEFAPRDYYNRYNQARRAGLADIGAGFTAGTGRRVSTNIPGLAND